MPHMFSASTLFLALSIFIMPTFSHADGAFTYQYRTTGDAEAGKKTKLNQQGTSKKTVKSTKTKRTSKRVKAVHSGSKPTIKSYVAYRKTSNRVSTRCFPKRLRAVLAKIERRYGVKPIVNSGFRSAGYNRRVGGARKSYHVKCMAADIKVPGVSKYTLARYVKSVSGIGGVGTYACKSFIHVDIGPKRSWHQRCRGKRGTRA